MKLPRRSVLVALALLLAERAAAQFGVNFNVPHGGGSSPPPVGVGIITETGVQIDSEAGVDLIEE